MSDNREILDLANRFESIATDGFEGRPYRPALADLATRVRERPGWRRASPMPWGS